MLRSKKLPKNKLFLALALLTCLTGPGCGLGKYEFHSLLEEQPYVMSVDPDLGSEILSPLELKVKFSQRIDLAKVTPESVALLTQVKDVKVLQDSDELLDGIREGTFSNLPLQYFLSSDETELTILTSGDIGDGEYHLVVTPLLLSAKGIPFNQKPGEAPAPFVAAFYHGPAPSPGGAGGETGEEPGEIFGPAPSSLMIHEFLYDGLASETDGEAFVELYGTPGADISLYQIQFINGSDGEATEQVTLPAGSLIGNDGIFLIADLKTGSSTQSQTAEADFLDHFDPQNGPDGLILLNREGNLLDSVVYGEGAVATTKTDLPLGEGSPAPDVSGGHSLSRSGGVDAQNNMTDFVDLEIPTPGIL